MCKTKSNDDNSVDESESDHSSEVDSFVSEEEPGDQRIILQEEHLNREPKKWGRWVPWRAWSRAFFGRRLVVSYQ